MIAYKRKFDEKRGVQFLIAEEKVFIKYMEILEKVAISKTNLIMNLYIVKNT